MKYQPLTPLASALCRRSALLNVRMRRQTIRKRRITFVFGAIWQSLFFTSLLISSWLGANKLIAKFFYKNPCYNIHRICINSDSVFSDQEVLKLTGLQLGDNIFTVNLETVRQKLLSVDQIGTVVLRRIVPDTLQIVIHVRAPVAWLASESGTGTVDVHNAFLLEASGTFYKPIHVPNRYLSLPIICGVNQKRLAAGDLLATEDLHQALELLRLASARHHPPIFIRLLDLSPGYCIRVLSASNTSITFSTKNFEEQLNRLQKLIKICAVSGRRIASINLFVQRNTPVRFVKLGKQSFQQDETTRTSF